MKPSRVALAVLAALPLSAQAFELGLFAGQQSYKSFSVTNPLTSNGLSGSCDSKTVFVARVGYAVADLGPGLLQLTAGFQPKATTPLTVHNAFLGAQTSDYTTSHASIGAMFQVKATVAAGIGLEYRFENLSTPGVDSSYDRPWLRANLGMAFPTPSLKPFFGLEAAFPLTSYTLNASTARIDDIQKAVAPKGQLGLYAGIRF
jgi:hypothetical protein